MSGSRHASLLRIAGVVACASSVTWAACSSFEGDDGDPPVEAGTDSPLADTASPTDGGVDADAPRGDSSCVSEASSLCDDFEGPLFNAAWTKTIGAPGDLVLSTEHSVSGTHALLVTMAGDAGGGQAFLRHQFDVVNIQGMTCDFELFAVTLSLTGGSLPSVVQFNMLANADSEAEGLSGRVLIASNLSALDTIAMIDGGFVPDQAIGAVLPLGSWQHFRFDVDLVSKEVTLTRNGATFLTKTAATAFTKNNGLVLTLGLTGYNDAMKYFIDDVVCNLR